MTKEMLSVEKEKLFSEFPPVSREEWEKKIIEDLKGADYEKKLIWKTIEEIMVNPYYTEEDILNLKQQSEYISFLIQESKGSKNNEWIIRQDIEEENFEIANHLAIEALKNGAEGLGLNCSKISSLKNLNELLNKLDISNIQLYFNSSSNYPILSDLLDEYKKEKKVEKIDNLVFDFDPISYLLLHGKYYGSAEENFQEAAYLFENNSKTKIVNVNAHLLHNAGANVVQELAFALASGNEYLFQISSKGVQIDKVAEGIMFSFATGSNYFMEIAKLRAARLLWAKILEEYKINYRNMYIHSYTSDYNKTLLDAYNNILRSTTEAMSAAIGGANSISVLPHNRYFGKPDKNSYRIARNIQLILKSESYFNAETDPSAGTYYIEKLTDEIAKASWDLFKEIESRGGYLKAIEDNFVQDKIEETNAKRKELVSSRKQTILGVNQYPNLTEKVITEERDFESEKLQSEFDEPLSIKKLKLNRLSQSFEELRRKTEDYVKSGKQRPKVFLFTIGNLAMRRARAAFSTNFFGCAGFEIIDNNGFCSIEEGIEEAKKHKPDIIVLCSSDEEYDTFGTELPMKYKQTGIKSRIIVAGNPKEIIEKLKQSGVDDFINISTNLLSSLKNLQSILGISK